jgi:hypothetical protein
VWIAREHARANPMYGDLTNAFDLSICVILSIAAAVTWAPLLGEKLSGPITGTITDGSFSDKKDWLIGALRYFENRGRRRIVLALAFMEGVRRPWLPMGFVMGLRNAREGSWLEKVFAREVFKFDNSQHCLNAFRILTRRGIDPRPHKNPQINLVLMSLDKQAAPEREPVVIPAADPPPDLQRDHRIKLP